MGDRCGGRMRRDIRTRLKDDVASTRVTVAAAAGVIASVVTFLVYRASWVPTVGWIVGAAIYLSWTWAVVRQLDSGQTERHATREDTSRPVSDLVLLVASVASLVAVGLVLVQGRSVGAATHNVGAGLAVLSVTASWLVVHTVYALHYARLYYAGPRGGIDFATDVPPSYRDFAYVAFTIGMTYQVSDTTLRTPEIRAAALRHGLLSFLLGAVIIGTTVTLVASLGR